MATTPSEAAADFAASAFSAPTGTQTLPISKQNIPKTPEADEPVEVGVSPTTLRELSLGNTSVDEEPKGEVLAESETVVVSSVWTWKSGVTISRQSQPSSA